MFCARPAGTCRQEAAIYVHIARQTPHVPSLVGFDQSRCGRRCGRSVGIRAFLPSVRPSVRPSRHQSDICPFRCPPRATEQSETTFSSWMEKEEGRLHTASRAAASRPAGQPPMGRENAAKRPAWGQLCVREAGAPPASSLLLRCSPDPQSKRQVASVGGSYNAQSYCNRCACMYGDNLTRYKKRTTYPSKWNARQARGGKFVREPRASKSNTPFD